MAETIHAALAAIQQELHAPKGQTNTFGNYKYRSCEDILAAVKPLLGKHGAIITLTDAVVEVGGRVYVKARATLSNADGVEVFTEAFAREAESKKGMDPAQCSGACSSYSRKYALNGLLAIDDSSQDPDATNDHGKGPQRPVTLNREQQKQVADAAIAGGFMQDANGRWIDCGYRAVLAKFKAKTTAEIRVKDMQAVLAQLKGGQQ